MHKIRSWLSHWLRLPPVPQVPFGESGSARLFKPSRRYFQLRLLRWIFVQLSSATGILVALNWRLIPHAVSTIEQLQFGKIHLMWVGSGHMVDNLIHQIDECCWLMDGWPVSCHGVGGREVGSDDHGQNLDTYSMEYTFANGKKAFCGFRRALKGHSEFATFVHGSKRAGQFSGNVHKATVHMFKDHRIDKDNIAWTPTEDAETPWDYEWINFIDSIRNDKPHNEAQRAVYADYASLMGRADAHTNQIVTWEDVTNSRFQFCDAPEKLNEDSPPPVEANEEGYFPPPHAGFWTEL